MRDTIAQELAGIAMPARAADGALTGAAVSGLAPGGLVPALEQCVEPCRRHMAAVRQLLDTGPGVDRLGEPRVPEIRLRVSGARRRLPLPVESVVLRSMREGIPNAVRRAAAHRVTVHPDHLPDRLRAPRCATTDRRTRRPDGGGG
ncbi:hypothetical protein GCM10023235_29920 [Kitasatospora terrestris]|uniref:DUF222 domain-containing protein n=1 Tax=Kitasatospora terrestris TaxID=258051 RepID=A0ABP9DRR6_9ACTN